MTDVRLTATNPNDSSIVPVACNAKGELLISEPTIEEIPNDVFVAGSVTTQGQAQASPDVDIDLQLGGDRMLQAFPDGAKADTIIQIGWNGAFTSNKRTADGIGKSVINDVGGAFYVVGYDQQVKWSVDFNGTTSSRRFEIQLDADDESAWVDQNSGEFPTKRYVGAVIDVGEELKFLRAQVQAMSETLKMTPEGGWPVWDGEDTEA